MDGGGNQIRLFDDQHAPISAVNVLHNSANNLHKEYFKMSNLFGTNYTCICNGASLWPVACAARLIMWRTTRIGQLSMA
jgi:hypothetical protein